MVVPFFWLMIAFPLQRDSGARAARNLNFLWLVFLPPVLIQTINVNTQVGSGQGQTDLFPSTHWSVVLAAGRSLVEPEAAQAALAELCKTYWAPLYSFVRGRGYSVHDAQDLTQSFFAYLIERKIYKRVDRQKGRFRSFLLASLKNFLADAADRERTLKRGGGQKFLPLHEWQINEAESLFQNYRGGSTEDQIFDQTWAETLVTAGLEQLSAAYRSEARENLFNELRIFVAGSAGPPPAYAELAVRLDMAESTLRSHVTRLRARYREVLRAEVRRTVDSETEVDEELRELLRVLARG